MSAIDEGKLKIIVEILLIFHKQSLLQPLMQVKQTTNKLKLASEHLPKLKKQMLIEKLERYFDREVLNRF